MMLKLSLVLSVGLLLAANLACQVRVGPREQDPWKTINNHLLETEPKISPKDNLRAAMKLLQYQRKPQTARLSERDWRVIKRLEKLETLSKMIKEHQCGPKANELRKELAKLTDTRLYPRVRVIYRHYAPALSLVCQNDLAGLFQRKKRLLDADKEKLLQPMHMFLCKSITNELGFSHEKGNATDSSGDSNRKLYLEMVQHPSARNTMIHKFIYRRRTLDSEIIARNAREVIEQYASNETTDNNARKLIEAGEIKEHFNRLIIEPCKDFIELFGPGLFDSARDDLDFLRTFELTKLRGNKLDDYFLAWSEFRVCRFITDDVFERAKLIRRIVRLDRI